MSILRRSHMPRGGPGPPLEHGPALAGLEARVKTRERGEPGDVFELARLGKDWKDSLALVVDSDRPLLDRNYAKREKIKEEASWKGKSDDELTAEVTRREAEVQKAQASLNEDPQAIVSEEGPLKGMDPTNPEVVAESERRKGKKALKESIDTLDKISDDIDQRAKPEIDRIKKSSKPAEFSDAVEMTAAEEVARLQKEGKTLTPDEILAIRVKTDLTFRYHSLPNAIDDSVTYAPVHNRLVELSQIPGTNSTERQWKDHATELVNSLKYNKDENTFLVKSAKEMRVEGDRELVKSSYRALKTLLGPELQALASGKKLDKLIAEIRAGKNKKEGEKGSKPNARAARVATLLYAYEKMNLSADQKSNIAAVLHGELVAVAKEDPTFAAENAHLGRYNHIVAERLQSMRDIVMPHLVEAGIDPKNMTAEQTQNLYRNLTIASVLEQENGFVLNRGTNHMEPNPVIASQLREIVGAEAEGTVDREMIINLAAHGTAGKLLENLFGITDEKLAKIGSKNIAQHAADGMVKEGQIEPGKKNQVEALLTTHLDESGLENPNTKSNLMRMLLAIALMAGLPKLVQMAETEGNVPSGQGQQPGY